VCNNFGAATQELSVCVCVCVNQGVTNHNHCTQTFVILQWDVDISPDISRLQIFLRDINPHSPRDFLPPNTPRHSLRQFAPKHFSFVLDIPYMPLLLCDCQSFIKESYYYYYYQSASLPANSVI